MPVEPLKPEELYKCCDPKTLEFFETTSDIEPKEGTIGQDRALKALDFGLELESKGFNIFILGEPGTGKMTTIKNLLKRRAASEPVPSDWCYVYNFEDPDMPMAIKLDPGKAAEFQKDMDKFIKSLREEISKVFESKEYEKQKNRIMEDFQKKQKELFGSLESEAEQRGFSIRKTVSGLLIVPMKKKGEPVSEEEFEKLPDEEKARIESIGKELQEKLNDVVRGVKNEEKLVKEKLEQLEREAALGAVGHYIEDLKEKYEDNEKIVGYLDRVRDDILEHIEDFKGGEEQQPALPFLRPQRQEPSFERYAVNVLVNNKETEGAPWVYESNPTYLNLFGRIEHKFQYGMATTDFTMIKPGALHRANGGYLLVDAYEVLKNIFSYDALKRAIQNGELRIEDVWEQYRVMSTTTLKPEPVPLDVKVVLLGNPWLYYLLYNLDEEYRELFKVKADFDIRMDRDDPATRKYAEFIAAKCDEEKLLHFDRTGVAKVVEYGCRLAGEQDKLSSKFSDVADLIRESHYWASKDGKSLVSVEHVNRALEEKIYRNNRIEERLRELMADGTLIVDTEGEKAGQINGLAVLSMGDYTFGKPSRITARAYAGKAGVVNIERETKMSGKIHEKAILIISNYLGSKYAVKKPISVSASITFEQLYDMVEGDSATCAELYALLSSLGGVPLKQSIAVTGSMDQHGFVQPIGGADEKIEGFFSLCKLRGLDGSHGVIIPRKNVKNLMLRDEVVDAVREGKFTIYPIDTMEEGLEILTGMPAGELQPDGTYPEGTVNHLVLKRLEEITEAMKAKKKKEKKEVPSGVTKENREEEEEGPGKENEE
ncbi:MAG: ATP-binding protein [Nitrospirota bacterium]|jgi:lon-related putative ATP-dependent protease